jgi:hypothetical protein
VECSTQREFDFTVTVPTQFQHLSLFTSSANGGSQTGTTCTAMKDNIVLIGFEN